MIFAAMAQAQKRGITTVFAVRGFGYYEPRHFEHVDQAFTCSQFLTDLYRDKVGLISTPIEPPIDWSSVVAPNESRAFVTFVHPAPHKGLLVFARLADMLGSRRPDISIVGLPPVGEALCSAPPRVACARTPLVLCFRSATYVQSDPCANSSSPRSRCARLRPYQ
jgi:hypothetical protein